jgi:uncharacterized membrane protein
MLACHIALASGSGAGDNPTMESTPLITNDAVVLGLLAATLGAVFWTTQSKAPLWQKFYKYVPALLLCYLLPALYNSYGLIDGDKSNLYFVASRYLLPTTLVLLTLSIDLPGILRLGPKVIILFLTGTVGVVIGGPIALAIWRYVARARNRRRELDRG